MLGDSIHEGNETVQLSLGNVQGSGAVLGTHTAHTATITDDDWHHADWGFRKAIPLRGATVCSSLSGTVSGFPVPIVLASDAELQANALANAIEELDRRTQFS